MNFSPKFVSSKVSLKVKTQICVYFVFVSFLVFQSIMKSRRLRMFCKAIYLVKADADLWLIKFIYRKTTHIYWKLNFVMSLICVFTPVPKKSPNTFWCDFIYKWSSFFFQVSFFCPSKQTFQMYLWKIFFEYKYQIESQ